MALGSIALIYAQSENDMIPNESGDQLKITCEIIDKMNKISD